MSKKLSIIFSLTFLLFVRLNSKYIDSIQIEGYYSNDSNFIPLEEGKGISLGPNIYTFENGSLQYKNLILNYSLREKLNKYSTNLTIFKLYTEYKTEYFDIYLGKKSKSVGPSENSIILSKNAPPFFMFDATYHKKNSKGGGFKINLINGWLDDKRKDNSNPKIMLVRIDYSPNKILNLGVVRHSFYGGDRLPRLMLWEYPIFLIGSKENVPYTKYDSDGYFGFDITVNLEQKFKNFDRFKIYFQQISTDIKAPWQKEDRVNGHFLYSSFPFIVKLLANSYQAGFEIKIASNTYYLEHTYINDLFYIHHLYYIEGYSYKGFCLGMPYGRYLYDIYFKHRIVMESSEISYKLGFTKKPTENKTRRETYYFFPYKMKRVYGEVDYKRKINKNLEIIPYLKTEYDINHDFGRNTIQFDIKPVNKLNIIAGIKTNITFK